MERNALNFQLENMSTQFQYYVWDKGQKKIAHLQVIGKEISHAAQNIQDVIQGAWSGV